MKTKTQIATLAALIFATLTFAGCAGPAVRHNVRDDRRDDRQDTRYDRRDDRGDRYDYRRGY